MPILITLITSSCVTIYILQRLSLMALKVLPTVHFSYNSAKTHKISDSQYEATRDPR